MYILNLYSLFSRFGVTKKKKMNQGSTRKGGKRERVREILRQAFGQTRGRHPHTRVSNNSSARSRLLTGVGQQSEPDDRKQ